MAHITTYKIHKHVPEIGPGPERFWFIEILHVDQVTEDSLVDVEVLKQTKE